MGADGTKGVQSRDLCFPLQVTIGKDNKQLLHTQFKPFYTEINQYEDKFTYENIVDQSCWFFSIAHPADMSALQKLVGRGGAIKNCTYACYCCNIHIDQVHVPNLIPCEFAQHIARCNAIIMRCVCQNCGRGLKKNVKNC